MPRESTAPAGAIRPASSKQLACEKLDAGQPPGGRGRQHPRADVDTQGPLEPIHEMGQHQARAAGQVDKQPIAAKRLAGGHDGVGRVQKAAVGVVLVQVAALVGQVGVPTVGLLVPTLANHLQPDARRSPPSGSAPCRRHLRVAAVIGRCMGMPPTGQRGKGAFEFLQAKVFSPVPALGHAELAR